VLYPKRGDDEQEEVEITTPFAIDSDEQGLCVEAIVKEKATQPPKPFTEGTLLKAMETAGRQIEDEELRDAMKDCGLGTPATRAGTIERLKQVGYIAMQGKRITITPKGRSAIELIRGAGVTLLASPDMTGEWERRLSAIARGQASASTFMESVKTFTRSIVDQVRQQPRAQRAAFMAPEAKQPTAGKGASEQGRSGRAAKTGRERNVAGAATKTRKRTAGDPEEQAPERHQAVSSGGATRLPTTQAAGEFGVADCPREGCGGRIFMGRKGYGCSHYKAGCGFVIWKQSFNKTLTDVMIRTLIKKGRTGSLKFQSDNGSTFEAKIILKDRQTGRIELER
jgi:DNA topoisomerase-3